MDTRISGLKLFLVLTICCASIAFLSGCGTVVIRGKRRPLLSHAPIRGEIEIVAEKRVDEHDSSLQKRKSTTNIFEERLSLKTKGDLYHPKFLLYDALFGFGFVQQSLDSDDESGTSRGRLQRYNLSVQVLRSKPYSIGLSANRSEEIIVRQFLAPLESEEKNIGISMQLRSKKWPMNFQYTKAQTTQNSLGTVSDVSNSFAREDERFRYSLNHDFSELSRMRFQFNRNNITQDRLGISTTLEENRYNVFHDLIFGNKEQHTLNSFLNFLDQSNSFDIKNLAWEEYLTLKHSDSFLTNYRFGLTDTKQDASETRTTHGFAGFEHRLYKSLITRGGVTISETEFNDRGNVERQGGSLNFNYRKKNRWGRLSAAYAINVSEQKRSSGASGTGIVINESHTVPGGITIVELEKVNIDVTSIIVRDANSLQFDSTDDYTVETVNGKTRLRLHIPPIGGGSTPNFSVGQQFFVTYNFLIEPGRKEEVLRQNFTIRQWFENGLSLYYKRRWQDETITSSETSITPDEFTANTLGVDYSSKGLGFLAEYSKKDSTIIPFTSKRLEAGYSWPINNVTHGNIYANSHWMDFGEPDKHDIRLFSSGADLSSRLTDQLSMSSGIRYHNEQDSRTGNTNGVNMNMELQYRYRRLSINTGLTYGVLERTSNRTKNTFLYFRLKRFF